MACICTISHTHEPKNFTYYYYGSLLIILVVIMRPTIYGLSSVQVQVLVLPSVKCKD